MSTIGDGARLRRSHMAGAHYRPCCHCGRRLSLPNLTIDHILPRSHGGRLSKRNTALACQPCNSERGTQNFWVFRAKKRAAVVGAAFDPSTLVLESPTIEQWEKVHGRSFAEAMSAKHPPASRPAKPKRKKWTQAMEDKWWLQFNEPTPRDSL